VFFFWEIGSGWWSGLHLQCAFTMCIYNMHLQRVRDLDKMYIYRLHLQATFTVNVHCKYNVHYKYNVHLHLQGRETCLPRSLHTCLDTSNNRMFQGHRSRNNQPNARMRAHVRMETGLPRAHFFICLVYGVATISRLLKITGLFCKKALQKRPIFCKETYDFKEPTNRSHPIV